MSIHHKGSEPKKAVTLKALAEYLGLSPATVSLVMNDSEVAKSIPQETKDRIFLAAKKLRYRPNYFARSLRRRRTFTVGVLMPEISEGYAASTLGGIEDRLLQEGYFYFMVSHRNTPDLQEEYPQLLMERGVEGFILLNTRLKQPLPVPAVSISGHHKMPGVTDVVVDNERAAWLAMEHLVKLGHNRIAFFKGHPHSADTEERWAGIVHAAGVLGVDIRPELTVQLKSLAPNPEPCAPEEGYIYAQRLLARGAKFTALFAFNDISAMGAIRAFRDAGLRVPEDVSVIGFDDIQAAAFQNPRLTTVRQPLRQMGELAAMSLLQQLTSGGNPPQEILVEPELVIRESTFAVAETRVNGPGTKATAGKS